jgi:hypothetical protein
MASILSLLGKIWFFFLGATEEGEEMERQRRWRMGQRRRRGMRRKRVMRRDWMVIEEIQVGMSWLNTWMNWRRISVAVAERVHSTSCDTTQDGGSTPLHPPHPDIHTHMMMMPFICSCRNNK